MNRRFAYVAISTPRKKMFFVSDALKTVLIMAPSQLLMQCRMTLLKKSRKMTLFLFLRGVSGDELAADFHKLCRALLFELGIIRAGQFLQIFL